jgi:hypothetical protein
LNHDYQRPATNNSEVARLVAQMTAEYEAAQNAVHGLAAGTARHGFITARMERMGQLRAELATEIGESEAMKLLSQALEEQ